MLTEQTVENLVNRYIDVSFSVTKKAEAMITAQIGSDLTPDQHYILRYINRVGSCTSTELAEVFEVNKSAITAIITRLWEKGFIQRTRDENDRRVVYLTLTEKGTQYFKNTEERIHHLVRQFITKFDQQEINQFIDSFEKLNKVLIELKEQK
ncbi:MarR family winged helix-turn-helix transcriptional regulator [Robertmurraya andreesenii]|uniref:DNA-binding MarR family transcriptional regulator n=1 Tax=Anoxybacillus andreesenii TaxID=1325932 RepID=A0ABT9V864_9BACL|nr:MarR family transcriptional regulator [Robertmurraya andreesenii]MDQ0157145.1 DNA-binding MarR family transcriptional regulator [Robertmurraya andreesenii]